MSQQIKPRKRSRMLSDDEVAMLRKKYKVDNWKNPSEYEYVKSLSPAQLKWEFVRRNVGYRKRYESKKRSTQDIFFGKYIDPAKRGNEIPKDYKFLGAIRQGGPITFNLPDVKKLMVTADEMSRGKDRSYLYEYIGWQLMELSEEGYLFLVFDPSFPGKEQFKEARKHFDSSRSDLDKDNKIERKIILQDAPKLLRILDAHNEGVSYETIGTEFYFVHKDDRSDAASRGYQHVKRAQSYFWKL